MIYSIRTIALISFFFSSLPLFFISQNNVCFKIGASSFLYLYEVLSSGNDDYISFLILAIFIILYTPILLLSKSKIAYTIAILIYFGLQSMIFLWIESTSAFSMITDSIVSCGNYYLLAWVILMALFILLSSVFFICF